MARLDLERQKDLEPKRIEYAKSKIQEFGFEIISEDETKIQFLFKHEKITLFPYSGWHTGKTIKDERGIEKLLKQIK